MIASTDAKLTRPGGAMVIFFVLPDLDSPEYI